MQKITAIVTIIVAATCIQAQAQAQEKVRKHDPQALAAAIAPFIDEQTILVGHVDLDRIDLDAAAGAFTRQIVPALGDQKGQLQLVRQLPKMLEAPKMILGALRKAGVRDAYFVLSLADIPGDRKSVV